MRRVMQTIGWMFAAYCRAVRRPTVDDPVDHRYQVTGW